MDGLFLPAAVIAVLFLLLFSRWMGKLLTLLLRTLCGAVFLLLYTPAGAYLGLPLGVNLFNAVVLGALGAPGFGLLLLLRWSTMVGI